MEVRPYRGRILFLHVFQVRPVQGFGRVHGKENALSFYALGTMSGVRQKRGVAEMKKDEVSAEKH